MRSSCANAAKIIAKSSIGCKPSLASKFVEWWDNELVVDDDKSTALLTMLESIHAERLADADAMQAVVADDDESIVSPFFLKEVSDEVHTVPGSLAGGRH
jgi:hypothetical protein